jgi:quinol monooxygenase YgiN
VGGGTDAAIEHLMVRLSVSLLAPPQRAQAIVRAFRTLIWRTRLETGCLACEVWAHQDSDDADTAHVHYEERWSSEQTLAVHVRSEGFTSVLQLLEESTVPPSVEFAFVSRVLGLEYVEDVRRGA